MDANDKGTLGGLLRELVERYGDRPALLTRPRYRTEIWTYRQLWDETEKVAGWLHLRGLRKGDRLILWAPNSPSWVAIFFGAARIGVIVCPLDVRSTDDFVQGVVENTEPALALVSAVTADDSMEASL